MKTVLWVIMALTFSAASFGSVNSLKGSTLKDQGAESGNEAPTAHHQEPEASSVIGGSMGGASEYEMQAEEERVKEGTSVGNESIPVNCEEALKTCRKKDRSIWD